MVGENRLSNVAFVEAQLVELAENKNKISLTAQEVRDVDQFLVDKWEVDCIETHLSLEQTLDELDEPELRNKAQKAYAEAVRSLKKVGGDAPLYDAMADPKLCGLITSKRRHLILDSIAFVAAIARALDIKGAVLDVGCHVGIIPDALQSLISNPIVGLEPIASAVKVAEHRVSNSAQLQFFKGEIPWRTDQRFEMISAIDCMPPNPGDRGAFLRGLSDLLDDGGVAVVVSAYWVDAELDTLRRQLAMRKFGFGLADVVGGWGGMPSCIEAEGVVILIKGGKVKFPSKIRSEIERNWRSFAEYANSGQATSREMTQAFHRAQASSVS